MLILTLVMKFKDFVMLSMTSSSVLVRKDMYWVMMVLVVKMLMNVYKEQIYVLTIVLILLVVILAVVCLVILYLLMDLLVMVSRVILEFFVFFMWSC